MGRRGPKPTPTAILKMRGSPLAAQRAAREPQPGRGSPLQPTWLMPTAKTIWRRLVPELEAMGVLTTVDGEALARYCQTLARWRRAQQVLSRRGETYATKTTKGHPAVKPRPEVSIVRGLSVDLAKLEAQFGMTPSARTSLTVNAIFTPTRPSSAPSDPPAGDQAPGKPLPPIQGKDRFFGGRRA